MLSLADPWCLKYRFFSHNLSGGLYRLRDSKRHDWWARGVLRRAGQSGDKCSEGVSGTQSWATRGLMHSLSQPALSGRRKMVFARKDVMALTTHTASTLIDNSGR